MSICSMTWLRRPMASSTVLKPMPWSARPGIGRVRETEPGARTSSSYVELLGAGALLLGGEGGEGRGALGVVDRRGPRR